MSTKWIPHALLLSTLLLGGLTPPARALPGKSLPELQSWTREHAFLEPALTGPLSTLNYDYAIASRQLDEQLFLDIEFSFNGPQEKALAAELILARKDYQPARDDNPYADPRPWVTTALLPIWSRSQPQALKLLEQVYGPGLRQDFQQARLIYAGPEYTAALPACHFRENIANFKYPLLLWGQQVQILLGQHFSYEISDVNARGEPLPGQSLKIFARAEGLASAHILAHNRWVAKLAKARGLSIKPFGRS